MAYIQTKTTPKVNSMGKHIFLYLRVGDMGRPFSLYRVSSVCSNFVNKNEVRPDLRWNSFSYPSTVQNFLFRSKFSYLFSCQVSDTTDPLVFAAVSHVYTRSLIHSGMPEHMITISQNGIVGLQDWLPYSKTRAKPFTFELDPSLSSNR